MLSIQLMKDASDQREFKQFETPFRHKQIEFQIHLDHIRTGQSSMWKFPAMFCGHSASRHMQMCSDEWTRSWVGNKAGSASNKIFAPYGSQEQIK